MAGVRWGKRIGCRRFIRLLRRAQRDGHDVNPSQDDVKDSDDGKPDQVDPLVGGQERARLQAESKPAASAPASQGKSKPVPVEKPAASASGKSALAARESELERARACFQKFLTDQPQHPLAVSANRHINVEAIKRFIPAAVERYAGALTDLFAAVVCGYLTRAAIVFLTEEIASDSVLFGSVKAWHAQIIIPVGFGLLTLHFAIRMILHFSDGKVQEALS